MVRDAPQGGAPHHEGPRCCRGADLILRSPLKAGVSKDGREEAANPICCQMCRTSPPELLRIIVEPLLDQLVALPGLPRDLIQCSGGAFGIGEAEPPACRD